MCKSKDGAIGLCAVVRKKEKISTSMVVGLMGDKINGARVNLENRITILKTDFSIWIECSVVQKVLGCIDGSFVTVDGGNSNIIEDMNYGAIDSIGIKTKLSSDMLDKYDCFWLEW